MNRVREDNFLEEDTLYILPTFLRVEEEMMSALTRSEGGVIFGKKIFTFPQLIERIYQEVPVTGKVISSSGQLVLIEGILHELYRDKQEGYFKSLITSKAFSKTLRNIINTLKLYSVSIGEFKTIVEHWGGDEERKLAELFTLYCCYQESLQRYKLLDHNEVSVKVRDFVIDQRNEIRLLSGVHSLRVEDIYDFTPVQFDLIVALAHRVKHTDVIIPYDHDRVDIFSYVERTLKKFEGLWELTIDINLDYKLRGEVSRAKLSEIVKRYYTRNGQGGGIEPLRIEDEVVVIEAPGIYQEAEAIGKEIRKLLDAGVKPNKIGVVFRDLALYSEMIEDVFQRLKIPLYFRRGKPLLSSMVVKTMLSIFELLDTTFTRDTFLKIMRSNYIDFWSGEEPLSGEKMEYYILKAGIIDGRGEGWEGKLTRLAERYREAVNSSGEREATVRLREEQGEVERLKVRVERTKREIEALKTRNTVGGLVSVVRRLIQLWGVYQRIMGCEDQGIVRRDIAALGKFEEILEEMLTVVQELGRGEERVTYNYFRNLLLTFIEESFILSGRETFHGVKVLNLFESRGLAFEYLFLGGLMEDTSPGRIGQDPLFKDQEKVRFNHLAGKKIFLLTDERWEEEPLLFYLGLSCARERLYLSYSQVDVQGRTLLPSLYFNEVMRLVDNTSHAISSAPRGLVVPVLEDCFEPEELENRLAFTIWKPTSREGELRDDTRADEEALSALLFNKLITRDRFKDDFKKIFECAEIEKRRELFLFEENLLNRKSKASVWTGVMVSDEIKRELTHFFEQGKERVWSPSHLESYCSCPFKFFLAHVLTVLPLKVPEEEIEKVDEGSLMHRVLERFYRVSQAEGGVPLKGSEEDKRRLKGIAEETYQQWEREKYVGNRALWEIRKKRLAPLWERFVEEEATYQQEEYIPTYFEFLIGDVGSGTHQMPELVVKSLEEKTILIGGRIDRVDLGSSKVRVVDYKNSSGESFYRDLLKEEKMGVTHFQLPVYLAAVKEYMATQHKHITTFEGAFYLLRGVKRMKPYVIEASDPFLESDAHMRAELRAQGRKNLFNQIAEIVRQVQSGDFSVCPRACTLCEYSQVCRFISVEISEGNEGQG